MQEFHIVGIGGKRPQVAPTSAELAILIPIEDALLDKLLRRAQEPHGPLLPDIYYACVLPYLGATAADHHVDSLILARGVVVSRRPQFNVRRALGAVRICCHDLRDLRVLEEEERVPADRRPARREASSPEAARIDRRATAYAPAAKVSLRPKTVVIGGVVDPVHLEIAIETNHLDDVVEIFDDPAGIQDCRPWLEPLHRTLDDLGTIPIESTEGRVTDAPTSVLLDCRNRTVRIRGDREELPRVPVEEAVHGHEGIEDEGRRRGIATLIDVPRDAPGQEQVEVARDDVHLGTPELHDRPAVLSGESTHADHDAILLIDSPVVELVAEAVPDLPAKNILSWPSLAVRDAQAAGVVAQAGALASACLVGAVGLLQL
mmetsp:Transcript_32971/g.70158  ORF Transcript_32971/g.70158 Transcript_32971/m.70158 type:complete len:375 (-) Transcript_32971:765-1889(-)